MHLRTIETSAADVAAALELIMPFGHGNRIPEQYIADKTREMELSNQHFSQAEPEVSEVQNDQLPVDKTPLVMKDNPINDVVEDADATQIVDTPTETKQDVIDHDETPSSVPSLPKMSPTTEEMSSNGSSSEPTTISTEIEDIDDRHFEEEGETQSDVEEENVSIAESFDFTISVSISDDEDGEEFTSDHLSAVHEESTSIEVIMNASMAEEDETRFAEDKSDEKNTKSLLVNDSMTSLGEDRRTVSPSAVKPHIIDIAVEDGEEEYFQSTTSRDSFLIKLSLLGALSDVIYDDFVEQVCEYKALVMTIVKRYDVCLLREIEKPSERKSRLKEVKAPVPKALEQEPKKHAGPRPEAKFVPLRERKQVLHLEPLDLPDFSYVEELVKRTKSQIRESTESAKEAVAQETIAQEAIVHETIVHQSIVEETIVEENENDEMIEEFSYVEELMKQSEAQIKETSTETAREEAIIVLDEEELAEDSEPTEPMLGRGSFDMFEEDLEEIEDVESRDTEEVIDLVQPAMLQGSGQQLPKFRAIIEIVEDGDDEPSTPEKPRSADLSRNETPSASREVQETEEVREPAEESAPRSSAFTKPKRSLTSRSSHRNPFAPSTTMATIRAEVEAKYSKIARPTEAFDRETLYSKSKTDDSSSTPVVPFRKAAMGVMMAQKAVSVTAGYKAPEVRVATAYAGGRTSERAMPEIINLVDAPEPLVVNLVDAPEPMAMAE